MAEWIDSSIAARDKFEEADFFLCQMKKTRGTSQFRYYLSAFLSASRSITLYLQKQFSDYDGFQEWYNKKQEWMKSDVVFQFIDENRDYVVHQGIAEGKHEVRIENPGDSSIPGEIFIDGSSSSSYTVGGGSVASIEIKGLTESAFAHGDFEFEFQDTIFDVETQHKYYFLDILDEMDVPNKIRETPVTEVCSYYLEKMNGIITEWEEYLAGELDPSELEGEDG